MALPILPIYAFKIPFCSSIAHCIESYVSDRVEDFVKDLPEDPMLEVTLTPSVALQCKELRYKTRLLQGRNRRKRDGYYGLRFPKTVSG